MKVGVRFVYPSGAWVVVPMEEVAAQEFIGLWRANKVKGKAGVDAEGWAVNLDQCCAIHTVAIEAPPPPVGMLSGVPGNFLGRSGL